MNNFYFAAPLLWIVISVAIVSVNTAPAVSKKVTGEAHYDSQLNTSTGIIFREW